MRDTSEIGVWMREHLNDTYTERLAAMRALSPEVFRAWSYRWINESAGPDSYWKTLAGEAVTARDNPFIIKGAN